MIDTDTPPTLILGDDTGGIAGPWLIADSDQFDAERRYWFYITDGKAADLPATISMGPIDGADLYQVLVNAWGLGEIEDALSPIPQGSHVTINYEFFSSPHGEQLIHWRLVMARIKEVRPDLMLAMYQVSPFKNDDHFDAIHSRDVDGLCLSVYPSRYRKHNLAHIQELVNALNTYEETDWWHWLPLTIATGWEPQDKPGETTTDEEIERRLYHIARELKRMGVERISVWDNPPKPGVQGRNEQGARRTAEIITEVYAAPPTDPTDPPAGTGDGDSDV